MTKQVAIYEMEYSCSPGGVDCWEATINGYGTSSTASDFKTAHLDLLAQLVRALPCHGRGRGFKSHTGRK